ncbi:MAG TPA: NAD-dependent epimerase/dehydratase family protein [Gammaproteobacteria bacterium]|nr:NAD-dependent epimerase/dehydratase family protein [Gammaproteobacteria bacterium]
MSVLVTGATGFIGRHLVNTLRWDRNLPLIALSRDPDTAARLWSDSSVEVRRGDLERSHTLRGACEGVETVFHLAGCTYGENALDPSAEAQFLRAVFGGAEALLAEAASVGVKRFVFVSSVKAMGEGGEACLDESSPARPVSTYGRAKLAAEEVVLEAGRGRGMHVSVVRLPLVYGPGNRGNIPRMIRAVDRGVFPPLADNGNRRSMVHVHDAVRALMLAAEQDAANQQVYIVTDKQVYSTRRIYDMIREALGLASRRWGVPVGVLRAAGAMGDVIGRVRGSPFPLDSRVLDKLIGSAWYSSEKISRELGFRPAYTLADALPAMVAEYHGEKLPAEENLVG